MLDDKTLWNLFKSANFFKGPVAGTEENDSVRSLRIDAETKLIDEIARRVIAFVSKRFLKLSSDDARDIAQETVLIIARKDKPIIRKGQFISYCLTIAFRLSVRLDRKLARFEPLENHPEPSYETEIFNVREKQVRDAVRLLRRNEQIVLGLFYDERLSFADIGMVLNKSAKAVSSIKDRAVEKIRKIVNSKNENDEH